MKKLFNKKRKRAWCAVAMLAFSISMTAFAKTTILDSISDKTFISSEHSGGLSATYHGKVSIYGKDRKQVGIVWKYPHCCRITYDVQGDITTESILSKGEKDGVVRTKEVTVKDKWNFGSKTTAKGYVELAPVTGESVSSIGDAEK